MTIEHQRENLRARAGELGLEVVTFEELELLIKPGRNYVDAVMEGKEYPLFLKNISITELLDNQLEEMKSRFGEKVCLCEVAYENSGQLIGDNVGIYVR